MDQDGFGVSVLNLWDPLMETLILVILGLLVTKFVTYVLCRGVLLLSQDHAILVELLPMALFGVQPFTV